MRTTSSWAVWPARKSASWADTRWSSRATSAGLFDADAPGLLDKFDLARSVQQIVQVTDWAPMVGVLPRATAANPTAPTPFLVGVTGFWR